VFSQEAEHFAAGRSIELWDGAKLKAIIRGVKGRPQTIATRDAQAVASPPTPQGNRIKSG
jgi:hypothetical protein